MTDLTLQGVVLHLTALIFIAAVHGFAIAEASRRRGDRETVDRGNEHQGDKTQHDALQRQIGHAAT